MALLSNAPDVSEDKKTGFTFRGEEIVLSKTRGAPLSPAAKRAQDRGVWSDNKRIEAATIFAATGNLTQTAELTKIPLPTVRGWRKEEWFQELLREIHLENNDKIVAKLTTIVDSALDQLADRVVNGDHVVLRDGQVVRRPIPAKDLSLVSAINIDKRQLLRGEATSRSESVTVEDKTVGRLEKLAETFEQLAKHGRVPQTVEAVDVQVIEEKNVSD